MRGIGVLGGVGWLCEPWRTYLNRFISASSSHCDRCTLIRCAGNRDPRMQRWVARTKVIKILLLTYPHVFEQDFFHLVARELANLFRISAASTPSSPSTEATKGEKCRRYWRYSSRYIRFFHLSASCRHLSGSFVLCVGCWCSRPACCGHCLSPAARGHGSAGRPLFRDLWWQNYCVVLFLPDPDVVAFVLFTARTEQMRGSSHTWEGVKAFPARYATPSRRSL